MDDREVHWRFPSELTRKPFSCTSRKLEGGYSVERCGPGFAVYRHLKTRHLVAVFATEQEAEAVARNLNEENHAK